MTSFENELNIGDKLIYSFKLDNYDDSYSESKFTIGEVISFFDYGDIKGILIKWEDEVEELEMSFPLRKNIIFKV